VRRLLRWYGANPLHLLALLGCFALAGYAAARLVPPNPLGVAIWFVGAVVGHDLVLMPLYALADWSAAAVIRHRAVRFPDIPWINYLRVPAAMSGLLFLVWFPLILRLRTRYQASTTLSPDPFLWHWLGVTGALFLLSAVAFAVRVRVRRRRAPASDPEEEPVPAGPVPPPPGVGTDGGGQVLDQGQRAPEDQRAPDAEPPGTSPADDVGHADDA
jgi:hypothetical protein